MAMYRVKRRLYLINQPARGQHPCPADVQFDMPGQCESQEGPLDFPVAMPPMTEISFSVD
jgi:hypothetical protein